MFDFKNLSIEELRKYLRKYINPLTGRSFNESDREQITKMANLLHSAVQDYELDFEENFVYIPGTDATVSIVRNVQIKCLCHNISRALKNYLHINDFALSAISIQYAINSYLMLNDLLEIKKINSGKFLYLPTELGENCGIKNLTKKAKTGKVTRKVLYSPYMQAYIIRMLPYILYDDFYYEYKVKYTEDLEFIEPLTVEEQKIIADYRLLNNSCKVLIKDTLNSLKTATSGSAEIKKQA